MNKTASLKKDGLGLFSCALRGALSAVFAALILSALTAAAGLCLKNPSEYTSVFASVSLFGAAFTGGFATARRKGSATLLCGAVTALFIIAAMLLASIIFSLKINFSLLAFRVPCVLLCSVLGANVGIGFCRTGKRKKKHSKNRA
jgi:putative membrane protein (TIGR04086 family)